MQQIASRRSFSLPSLSIHNFVLFRFRFLRGREKILAARCAGRFKRKELE